MIDVIMIPLLFLAILSALALIWRFFSENHNHISEKDWHEFYLYMYGLYQKYDMNKYGPFYSRWSFKAIEIGEMCIYLKKMNYSFRDHFLKKRSNIYYAVYYMPYGEYVSGHHSGKTLFELYSDILKLEKEFPILIRDRKKIYKKQLIERICKEKDIC